MFGSSQEKAVVASAPGKVLLAGGYLVLDRKYTGLVFGLSARIHVVVRRNEEDLVVVRSPQFKEAEWRYKVTDLKNGAAVDVEQMEDRYVQYLPYSQFLILGHGFMKCQESSCSIVLVNVSSCCTCFSISQPLLSQ